VKTLKRKTSGKNLVTVAVQSDQDLQSMYMPFVQNGGLFLSNDHGHALGDEFFLLLSLAEDPEPFPLAVQVVWQAGDAVKAPHRPGIGVQFLDPDNEVKDRIETLLAGTLRSATATATM
jgi:type IV pilus assembly protein PilZ